MYIYARARAREANKRDMLWRNVLVISPSSQPDIQQLAAAAAAAAAAASVSPYFISSCTSQSVRRLVARVSGGR